MESSTRLQKGVKDGGEEKGIEVISVFFVPQGSYGKLEKMTMERNQQSQNLVVTDSRLLREQEQN